MTQTKKTSPTHRLPQGIKGLTGLYLYNIGANLVGIGTIFILDLSTPVSFFKINREIIFDEGGWKLFPILYPLLVGMIFLIQFVIQRPIARTHAGLRNGHHPSAHASERARRRLLNLPFIVAVVNRVKAGDFNQRIAVVSNDEIGVLTSNQTLENLNKSFQTEVMPPQPVKGYSKPINIHKVLGSQSPPR